MTVYVVICSDGAEGGECWTHGVYVSKATAERVFNRLTDDTYYTVRLQQKRVYRSQP